MTTYTPMRLTGSCRNGFERDSGAIVHAVPTTDWKALCGARPGKRSAGWSVQAAPVVNCPKCLKRLARLAAAAEQVFGDEPVVEQRKGT